MTSTATSAASTALKPKSRRQRGGQGRGRLFTVRLSLEDKTKMDAIKRRDGVPLAEQIRFALTAWLAAK